MRFGEKTRFVLYFFAKKFGIRMKILYLCSWHDAGEKHFGHS